MNVCFIKWTFVLKLILDNNFHVFLLIKKKFIFLFNNFYNYYVCVKNCFIWSQINVASLKYVDQIYIWPNLWLQYLICYVRGYYWNTQWLHGRLRLNEELTVHLCKLYNEILTKTGNGEISPLLKINVVSLSFLLVIGNTSKVLCTLTKVLGQFGLPVKPARLSVCHQCSSHICTSYILNKGLILEVSIVVFL